MTRSLSILFLLLLSIQPLVAQTIVIEDFDGSGFDFYTAGASDWNTSAVIGPSYLTIGPNAMGNGNATISRFFRTIPDLTGITEIQIDLRLGSGNQVNQMGFYIADALIRQPIPTQLRFNGHSRFLVRVSTPEVSPRFPLIFPTQTSCLETGLFN